MPPKDIPQIKPVKDIPPANNQPGDSGQPSILVPQGPMPVKKFDFKILAVVSGVIFLLVLVIGLSFFGVYQKAARLIVVGKDLQGSFNSQDIPQIKNKIGETKKAILGLKSSYMWISWTRFIPFFGSYVSDLGHAIAGGEHGLEALDIAVSTLEPYANLLGFGNGEEASDGEKTTQERIDFFVNAIPDLIPKVDGISGKVSKARDEFTQINPDRYPVRIGKRTIREPLRNGLELIDSTADVVADGKGLLESSPYLLGLDEPRQYLVLFQNDKELRPTGGFLTAYSIMKVDKAKFEPVSSNDIYNLDAKYRPQIPAPDPIVKYIKGPYILSKNIRLRDMNWSPDFAETMALFIPEAKKAGVGDIDGVIAVDTQLLVNLLDVLGQIGVPGFGNFSTQITDKCNCPQVIYELESFADVEGPIIWDPLTGKIIYRPPNSDNRKKIIGPLMNSILANAMGQPKEKIPALFEAAFKSLLEKHVVIYVFDEKSQTAAESFGIAGKIRGYDGDYLHINDANLGGRKSNLYVTQEVDQEIVVAKDGTVEKTVTITYKNPEKHDGWLNSVLPNWVRIYVPKGSQLIAAEGLEDKAQPYEDLGKTVFAGFFQLRPEGVSKVTFKYKLPGKFVKDYKLLIQKQPGTDTPLYTIKLGKQTDEFFLQVDKELKLRI